MKKLFSISIMFLLLLTTTVNAQRLPNKNVIPEIKGTSILPIVEDDGTGTMRSYKVSMDSIVNYVSANEPFKPLNSDSVKSSIRTGTWIGDYEAWKTSAQNTSTATEPHPIYSTNAFSIFSGLGNLFMEGGYYASTGLNKPSTMQIQTSDLDGSGQQPNQFWFNNQKKINGVRTYPDPGRSLWFRGRNSTPATNAKDVYGFEFYHYGLQVHDFKLETTLAGKTSKEVTFGIDTLGNLYGGESYAPFNASNSGVLMIKEINGKNAIVQNNNLLYDYSQDRIGLMKETYFMTDATFDPIKSGNTLTLNGNVTFDTSANVKLPVRTDAPSNPVDGQIFIHDSDGDGDGDHVIYWLDGQWFRMSRQTYTF